MADLVKMTTANLKLTMFETEINDFVNHSVYVFRLDNELANDINDKNVFVNHLVNDFLPLSWGNLRPSFADTFVDRANELTTNVFPDPPSNNGRSRL